MFGRIVTCFILGVSISLSTQSAVAENHKEAEIQKENVDSGTTAYRLVRYTQPNLVTCTAYICERRDSQKCGTADGLFSVTKRTAENYTYVSYYPADREASRKLRTTIQIGTFDERYFYPLEGYPETWIVPTTTENEDMLFELERANRSGPVRIVAQTETFAAKTIHLRDLAGMERDVRRMCPTSVS